MSKIKRKNQQKFKLNKEMLKKYTIWQVIQHWTCYIEHPRFNHAKTVKEWGNLEEDGRSVQVDYVIIKQHGNHRSLFHSLCSNLTHTDYLQGNDHLNLPTHMIAKAGQREYGNHIKEIVDATDEVYHLFYK